LSARRLLVVAPGIPHPTEGASTVLFFHYIDALKRAGFDLFNVLLLENKTATPERLSAYEARMTGERGFQVKGCWSDTGWVRTGWRRGHQLDRRSLGPLVEAARSFRPDAIVCLDFLSAWAASEIPGRRLVWLGDLNFQSFWYNSLYSWKEGLGSLREVAIVGFLSHLWKRLYRRVLRRAERVVVASKSSEPALARLGIAARYLPYPWPADPPATGIARDARPTLLFFGSLQGLGSRSALHMMLDRLYPALVARFGPGKFQIVVCGRGTLPDWARASAADKPEIELKGFVDDLPALMARGHAFAAPMDVPVGNRSRIVTAMAQRLLVIAHPSTALGNPDLVDLQTCHLAATPEAFVERFERAIAQPAETAAIVDRAFAVYSSKFAPERASALMVREVEQLMEA
jgi:hypothetical protein